MGFSFSGLSLVTAAAAEADTHASAPNGAGVLQRRDASFLSGKTAVSGKSDSSDSESDWNVALCACADGQTQQQKDVSGQASPFSAVLSSAVGASVTEPSSAGSDSLSILVANELDVPEGTAGQKLAELLGAIRAEAGFPLPQNAPDTLAPKMLARLEGATLTGGWTSEAGSTAAEGLPTPSARLLSNALADALAATPSENSGNGDTAASTDAGPALSAVAQEQADPEAAIPDGGGDFSANRDAAAASLAATQTAGKGEMPADDSRNLSAAVTKAAANKVRDGAQRRNTGREASPEPTESTGPENELENRNPAEARPKNLAESTTNAYASATAGASGVTPETAAGTAPQTSAPRPNAQALPQQQPGDGIDISTAATSETQTTQRSEVAFQAELRVRSEGNATDTARTKPQPNNLAALTAAVRETVSTDSEPSLRQTHEPQAMAKAADSEQREAFRRGVNLAGGSDSFGGQDQSGGSLDRGTQQTTPLQGVAGPQAASSMTASPKPTALPAAAQLDAIAETPAAETNQPARSVAFKIQTADRGAANVILTDRGGQVHMTVRSSDPALTQTLRSDLGSLAGGLQQHGFDVKVWNPSSGSSTGDNSRGDTLEFNQDDTRGPRQRHPNDDAEQRGRRPSDWPEEID